MWGCEDVRIKVLRHAVSTGISLEHHRHPWLLGTLSRSTQGSNDANGPSASVSTSLYPASLAEATWKTFVSKLTGCNTIHLNSYHIMTLSNHQPFLRQSPSVHCIIQKSLLPWKPCLAPERTRFSNYREVRSANQIRTLPGQ